MVDVVDIRYSAGTSSNQYDTRILWADANEVSIRVHVAEQNCRSHGIKGRAVDVDVDVDVINSS